MDSISLNKIASDLIVYVGSLAFLWMVFEISRQLSVNQKNPSQGKKIWAYIRVVIAIMVICYLIGDLRNATEGEAISKKPFDFNLSIKSFILLMISGMWGTYEGYEKKLIKEKSKRSEA